MSTPPVAPAPVLHHNGFVTFLDHLGNNFLKVEGVLVKAAPAADAITKVVGTDISIVNPVAGAAILGGDAIAERLFAPVVAAQQAAAALNPDAAGADKLKLSVSAVEQILLQYPGLAGKQPTDAAKYTATVTGITSLLADFLNLFPGA